MSSWAQHARHFGEETWEVWVAVRSFDIDHGVEGFVGEGQVFGVALHEFQAGQLMPLRQNSMPAGFRSSPV